MQCLSTVVCACNDGVLPVTLGSPVRAQASVSRLAAPYPNLYPPLAGRDWGSLGVDQGIGAGGFKKHKDVVRLISSFVQLTEKTTAGFGAR